MKVLHIYKDYFPIFGGIEGNLKQVAEGQAARGHDVTVLVTNPSDLPGRETLNGVKIVRARRLATVASTPLSLTLPLLLRAQRPDLVHLHFPYPVGEVSQLFLGRTPYVISYHSDVVKQKNILRVYRPLLKRVLRNAAAIMVGSPNYVESSEWLREVRGRCVVVPYGIDVGRYERLTGNSERVIVNEEEVTILFLGRHRHYKGGDILIRAVSNISNVRLLIGGDGPERESWEALTTRLGLAERVTFLGNIPEDEKPALYQSADIFVLPAVNRAEAFGIVLLEAMASGLPCVTSELGTGTSFVVQNGETGLVVPPRDPAVLADALRTLVDSPELRRQFGEAGRRRLEAEFTTARMLGRISDVYRDVING